MNKNPQNSVLMWSFLKPLLKCNFKDQFDTKSEVILLLNYNVQELICNFSHMFGVNQFFTFFQ